MLADVLLADQIQLCNLCSLYARMTETTHCLVCCVGIDGEALGERAQGYGLC